MMIMAAPGKQGGGWGGVTVDGEMHEKMEGRGGIEVEDGTK